MHSWRDVGAFCDRLVANLSLVTEGDELRATVLALSLQQTEKLLGPCGCFVRGGLPWPDGVLVLLRVRLAGLVSERASEPLDGPVPYALTLAGLLATAGA